MEYPQGFSPNVISPEHEILAGLDEPIPDMLGYNRTVAKSCAETILKHGDDPILAVRDFGKGRTMAYTCDCSPHWASPELCTWKYYGRLWQNIVHYLARN